MQLTIGNPGKALIHFMQARSLLQFKYNEIANCPSCAQERKDSLLAGTKFFDNLFSQLKEQVDANPEASE